MTEDAAAHPDSPSPPAAIDGPAYPALDELGQLLPQYEMHGIVGIGGMGAVYKARQIALDRWVAIKVLPASAAKNPEDAQRFIKEARAMAKLVHPHIVAVFDFGQTLAGHLYLVMEYVEGADLHRRTRAGEITAKRARELIAQLCDALMAAHERGVAHRDVKPANILITNDWKVKVADFGLARELTASPNPDEAEYGTPDYVAPERLISGAEVDHRADIYSLGVVIHEILTGKTPAAAGAAAGIALPPGFAGVISKCLMRDPARRYQSAAEVKVALLTATAENARELASAPPTPRNARPSRQAPEPGLSRQRRRSTGLAPILWGLASVALLAAVGALVLRSRVQPVAAPPEMAPLVDAHAGASDLAVFAPRKPEPAAHRVPADLPPDPRPVAQPPSPALATNAPPPSPPARQTKPASLAEPYRVPEGPPGEVARLSGHSGSASALVITRDQARVISAGRDGAVIVWDLQASRPVLRLDSGIGDLARLSLSSDESQALAVSEVTDQVALLDLDAGTVKATLKFPHDRLNHAMFLPGEREALLGGGRAGQGLYRWDLTGKDATLEPAFSGSMIDLEAGPDGKVFLAGLAPVADKPNSFSAFPGWYSPGERTFSPVKLADLPLSTIVLSPDGAKALLLGRDGFFTAAWPALTLLRKTPIPADLPRPRVFTLADQGKLIAGIWQDDSLRVVEVGTGDEAYRADVPLPLSRLALSADERWVILSTFVRSNQPTIPGSFDLLVWRLPGWRDLFTDEALALRAKAQMADLAKVDPELAGLRDQATAALPVDPDLALQAATLRTQYVSALQRAAVGRSPTEQRSLLAEAESIQRGGGLPAEGVDVALPESLRRLRTIYRQQVAALNGKRDEAVAARRKAAADLLEPVRARRVSSGDRQGAARVALLLEELLGGANPASGTSASTPTASVANRPGPGTPIQRPSRLGTVFAIPRSVPGQANFPQPSALSRIPGGLDSTVAIAGGEDHAFALDMRGGVDGWGSWGGGQPVAVPVEATDVVKLASTSDTACVLRGDGRVVAWVPGQPAVIWEPPSGKAVLDICAGESGAGYAICTDGSLHPIGTSAPPPPPETAPVAKVFSIPGAAYCAALRDGAIRHWGADVADLTPQAATLRDVVSMSFGKAVAVALLRDGTLTAWGVPSASLRFRTRKFTGSLEVAHDHAARLFPVHRGDHSWELIPNPGVPDYAAEERPSALESKLRGCSQAVFASQCVIAFRFR